MAKKTVKPIPPPRYFTHYKPTPDWPEHAETGQRAVEIYKQALAKWEEGNIIREKN